MAARPVALVTGSTSGIGAEVARTLSEAGMQVVVHSRHSAAEGERLAAELGGSYLQADLEDLEQTQRVVEEALAELGRLDVLINNAAVSFPIPHDDLAAADVEVWQQLLTVNLVAPWVLTTLAEPYLRRSDRPGGGCVVNVTSHAGVRPKGSSVPYAASKAALNHVTRTLAVALGPNVRVNAVAPGLVDTPMTADWTDAQELWSTRSPMRRSGTPADVAHVVAALVDSAYVTGEVVVVDGGMNLT
ncbi:MAG TPA: SDR family oxidoreductase [Nocardioides sp.]|uniref:SDR family NAD(P)-dependent oxidoreductase n=1 Tax=uncultured Nocardioides sp. TaxID=198441 RepID=UPI000ECF46DC|nr:SDR family oxidoreductase [uncultured Nocardioides sp.]HCB03798.1 short-chain dehydrogenase [Nocardioides sp.]HRI98710.1 SDR family oxidoreductase [Nocardioides sp.]HRK48625.1 SDR family oxidoreductase [Nocardioides sp.]